MEHRVVWPDGSVHWMLERGDVTRDGDGSPAHLLGVVQDITERRLAQERLQASEASEASLAKAQRIANLGNWDYDLASGRILWSEEVYRIFGFEPGGISPDIQRYYAWTHPEDLALLLQAEERTAREGRGEVVHRIVRPDGGVRFVHLVGEVVRDDQGRPGVFLESYWALTPQEYAAEEQKQLQDLREEGRYGPYEKEYIHKDGHRFPVLLSGIRLTGADGREVIWFIVQDISERKGREEALRAAKEEAERANRAKSLFLSSMSHELRTPMNAILGFAQLLRMHRELTADQGENVDEILKAGRHLLNLINEVLDLAKVEAGKIELSLEPVSCCDLARESLALVRPLAEHLGIRIREDFRLACPVWFLADRTRLKQVLVNLLSNAIKYNRPEGSVVLAICMGSGGFLRVEVQDTGLGIRPEQQAGLFQPFHRLHDVDSGIEGTGIGLAICKRLIEAMGGRVGLESTYGVGSTFWLELPPPQIVSAAPANPVEAELPEAQAGASAVRLLYVEDNPANLLLLERFVRTRPGWRLHTAPAPLPGLELARAHAGELDAILLDINLPGMDGYQVLKRLQADPVTAAIPVLAISANAMPGDIERGLRAGFVAYLTKPLDLDRLEQALGDLPAGRASEPELERT